MRHALLAATLVALALAAAVPAQGEWLQAETEHFRFVFEPGDRASVDELLAICEDVYEQVTGFFGSRPAKVDVVVRGRLDYANGFTTPAPSRIELILSAPSWPWQGSRGESWLRLLLTHELTHYVHFTIDRGLFGALSRIFGYDARWGTIFFLPGWMIEGPTTNTETRFTQGGRGRNPFFEALYRAPTMEGTLFSLAQAGYPSDFPPSGRIYVAGYVLVDWLLDTFGEDAFARITNDYVSFPFFGPWAAIRRVTGMSGREAYEAMRAQLEERYRAAAAVAGGRIVTPDRISGWYHPTATDRGLYLYREDLEGFPAIVSLDLAGGAERVLIASSLSDESSFTASRDGRTVCWADIDTDGRAADGETAVSDLWELDVASGRSRRITTGAHLRHPALSVDGTRLLAVQGTGPYTRLVEVDRTTAAMRVLFSSAGTTVYNPAVSPDGSAVAFAFNQRGIQDVFVMDLAAAARSAEPLEDPRAVVADVNRELVRPVLGPDAFGEFFPSWNGDSRLLFSSDRSGSLALYEADLVASTVTLVQEDPVAAYEGIVDAEGLLYASYSPKGWCLKRAPLSDLSGRPAATVVDPAPSPAAATGAASSVEAATYRDRARAYLWTPTVGLGGGLLTSLNPSLGLVVDAASLLGTRSWSASCAWYPLSGAQTADLAYAVSFGPVSLELGLAGAYAYYPGSAAWFLDAQPSLDATLTLWARSVGDHRTSGALAAGIVSLSEIGSTTSFSIFDALQAPAGAWLHLLFLRGGVGASWLKAGGDIDFYPPWLLDASLGGTFLLPTAGLAGQRTTLFLEADVPSLIPHHVLRAGLKAAYGFGYLDASSESFAAPRGSLALPDHALPGRALVSLDYLAPIALLDQPLFAGLALLGVSAGLHAEATADWAFAPGSFELDRSLYAGAELTLLVATPGPTLPLTAGVVVRFDLGDGGAIDPAEDIGWYVGFTYDSFAQGLRDRRADGPTVGPTPLLGRRARR